MDIFITNPLYKEIVLKFISAKTGINHNAFTVNIISEIPKNEAGKTLYKELELSYV